MDINSSIFTRYGNQQGSKRGYNAQKPGRNSHHPLLAFTEETRMIANFWLRRGNAYTSNNFQGFLSDTIEKLNGKNIGLLRADSGFYGKEVFDYLEENELVSSYIIAARQYRPIQKKIAGHTLWIKVSREIEVGETTYQSPLWDKPRRLVMVRQLIAERPNATGKSFNNQLLRRWLLNLKNFDATEAALNWVIMAYNFISVFRQVVLNTKVEQRMKALRYKVFAIGSYLIKNGNQRILKLSIAVKRRAWFSGLWYSNKTFEFPVLFKT